MNASFENEVNIVNVIDSRILLNGHGRNRRIKLFLDSIFSKVFIDFSSVIYFEVRFIVYYVLIMM